jgi:ribosomal protein L23
VKETSCSSLLDATDIIIKPARITATKERHRTRPSTRNTYAFHVHPRADKTEIKGAVEKLSQGQ